MRGPSGCCTVPSVLSIRALRMVGLGARVLELPVCPSRPLELPSSAFRGYDSQHTFRIRTRRYHLKRMYTFVYGQQERNTLGDFNYSLQA